MNSYFDDVYDDNFDSLSLESLMNINLDWALEADDGTDLLGDNSSKPFDDSKPDATPSPGKTEPADNDGTGGGGNGQTTGGMTTNPEDATAQLSGDEPPPDNPDDEGGEGEPPATDEEEDAGDPDDPDGMDEEGTEDESADDGEDSEDNETDLEKKNLLKERYMKLYEAVDGNLTALETNKSAYNAYDSHKYSIMVQKFTLLKDKLFRLITNKKFFTQEYSTCLKFYLICNELYTTCVKMAEAYFDEMDKALKDGDKRKRNKSDKK